MSETTSTPLHLERGFIRLWWVWNYPVWSNVHPSRILPEHADAARTAWVVRFDPTTPMEAPTLFEDPSEEKGYGDEYYLNASPTVVGYLRRSGFDFSTSLSFATGRQPDPPPTRDDDHPKYVVMKDKTFFLFDHKVPHLEAPRLIGKLDPVAVLGAGYVNITPEGVTVSGKSISLDRKPRFDGLDAQWIAEHLHLPVPDSPF
jgi:hypothetical protein